MITQNSLLGESTALENRKLLMEKTNILKIDSFPERDNVSKRVFESVKMSVCIGLFAKNNNPNQGATFVVNTWKDRYFSEKKTLFISMNEIRKIYPSDLIFPLTDNENFDLLKKIKSTSNCISLESSAGEIDMTKYKSEFTQDKKMLRVITGAQVHKYNITDNPQQGGINYLPKKILENFSVERRNAITSDRIVMQRITGVDSKIRIIATLLKENNLCANSTNYILCNEKESQYYYLGLLNSKLINFYFKQTSTNTNVTAKEISSWPLIKADKNNEERIINIVKQLLRETNDETDNKELQQKIDEIVYSLYNLSKKEIELVESIY